MSNPHHDNTVDEHVVRIVAVAVTALAAVSLHPRFTWISIFLAADFFVRAWVAPRLSPLRWFATRTVGLLKLRPKAVYAPPKVFASRLGSAITLLVVVMHLGSSAAATVMTLILIAAAGLEALANFCIACWIYPYVHRLRHAASLDRRDPHSDAAGSNPLLQSEGRDPGH